MKRFLPLLILFFGANLLTAQTNYFVSPLGNDNNNGTSAINAWQTLSRASQQIFSAGDSIFFECGGIYRGTFFLKGVGNSFSKIYVGAYGVGNAPIISGAEILQNPSWQNENINGINTIKTLFADTACFVYADGAFNQLARFPDDHFLFVDNVINNGSFALCGKTYPRDSVIVSDSLKNITMDDLTDAYVNLRTSGWNIATFKAISFDKPTGTLAMHSSSYGWSINLTVHNNASEKYGFFLSNRKEFLSQPSEFWVDNINQQLYLATNTIPASVEYSKHKYGIKIIDAAAHDIIINGITFQYQSLSAIELKEYDNKIEIRNCDFRNMPFGIHNKGESSSSDCLIRRALSNKIEISTNNFTDIYRSPIACYPANSKIVDNKISRVAVLPNVAEWLNLPRSYDVIDFGNGAAIQTGFNCLIERNTLDSLGHYGIIPQSNSVIEKNIINHGCLNYYDCGALYSVYSDSIVTRNNFVTDCAGSIDKGILLTPSMANPKIAGNGIYLDYNGDLRFTYVEATGNTISDCGRGIGFITTEDFLGQPDKYGNGFCSPYAVIQNNVLYNNHTEEFGVGAMAIPDINHIPSNFQYEPLQFTGNSVVHFDEETFALRTSNSITAGVNWGNYNNNHFASLNTRYIAGKHYRASLLLEKEEWLEPYEWQEWGKDSASTFALPLQSNIFVNDTLQQGNLIRNAQFKTNLNNWDFKATNALCLNNTGIDSTDYFPSKHLIYYNPSGLGGINNSISIKTNLADSSNIFSPLVNIDSSKHYLLSFDVYSSLPVNAQTLGNTIWTVSLTNTQNNAVLFKRSIEPRDTLQHFKYIFKPKNSAEQAYLEFFSYKIQGNYALRLDNICLFPIDATEWAASYKFPLITNASDDAVVYDIETDCFLHLDGTTAVSPLIVQPWSSVVLIRLDTCKIVIDPNTPIKEIDMFTANDRDMQFALFPNPANDEVMLLAEDDMLGERVIIYDLFGREVFSHLITSGKFNLKLSNLSSGIYFARIGNCTKKIVKK